MSIERDAVPATRSPRLSWWSLGNKEQIDMTECSATIGRDWQIRPLRTAVNNRATLTPLLCTIFFTTLAMAVLIGDSAIQHIGFQAEYLNTWTHYHTLFTYCLIHESLVHWFRNCAFLFIVALIIEPRLTKDYLLFTIIVTLPVNALLFASLSDNPGILIGSAGISWTYAGVLFAIWLLCRRTFTRYESIITGIIAVLFVLNISAYDPVIYAQLGTAVIGFIMTLIGKNKFVIKNCPT